MLFVSLGSSPIIASAMISLWKQAIKVPAAGREGGREKKDADSEEGGSKGAD